MVFVTICTLATMSIVYKMTSRVQRYADAIARKTEEIEDEKKRTETLLYEVLNYHTDNSGAPLPIKQWGGGKPGVFDLSPRLLKR